MTEQDARIIGLKGLEYLAEDHDRLAAFLGNTGISAEDLHQLASEPGTIIGILDYLLGNEALLLDFATTCDLAPDLPGKARMILSKEDLY